MILGGVMNTKTLQKKVLPPPGKKLTPTQARVALHKQFGNALAKLAKQ